MTVFPSPFVGLLLLAVPGLAPFAGLLGITVAVVSAIKFAMNTVSIIEAIKRHAPELLPELHRLAAHVGTTPDHVARAMIVPHQLTVADLDFWTDHLNKARNL